MQLIDTTLVDRPEAPARPVVRERLIVFTRFPEPGQTKTRLIPALGADGAAALQEQMTRHTLRQTEQLAEHCGVEVEVCFAGGTTTLMRQRYGRQRCYVEQSEGNLGERMTRALVRAFDDRVDAAVIIGIDCPGVRPILLRDAFTALRSRDLVLGPATDGGYYLIGLSRPAPELFENVAWGTDTVLETTMTRAREAGLSVHLLETLDDVDRPEDLAVWEQAHGASTGRISFIVPTFNEARNLPGLLALLGTFRDAEVIVADGGSTDDTVDLARAGGARVVLGATGRAAQLNAGAAAATGETLIFLHADTRLTPDGDVAVRRALADPRTAGGCFTAQIDSSAVGMRLIAFGINLRTRLFRLPYGDQALFVRRSVFEAMGGYTRLVIMEDVDFVKRLRRHGRLAVLTARAITSDRRWVANGVLRTTLVNYTAATLYALGVSPERIRRFYDRRLSSGDSSNA
jgi:hypothetical protein